MRKRMLLITILHMQLHLSTKYDSRSQAFLYATLRLRGIDKSRRSDRPDTTFFMEKLRELELT